MEMTDASLQGACRLAHLPLTLGQKQDLSQQKGRQTDHPWALPVACVSVGLQLLVKPPFTDSALKPFNVSIRVNATQSKPNVPRQQSVKNSSCLGASSAASN